MNADARYGFTAGQQRLEYYLVNLPLADFREYMTGVSDAYDRSHRANNTFKHGGDFLLTRVTLYS